MIESDINIDDVPYLYDQSGRICIKNDKVYRIIEDEKHIANYRELLSSEIIEDLYEIGLVRTKVIEEVIDKSAMILEHKKIPFILHPSEYSNKMFWQAAYMFVELNMKLWEKGFITHDSHPYNISFEGNKPIFYDFGSIVKGTSVSQSWLNEFFQYVIAPIALASYSSKTYKYSKEYRREHSIGFGTNIFKSNKLKKILFRRFKKLELLKNDPEKLYKELLKWLNSHKPIFVKPEYWSEYYKSSDFNYDIPMSIKQQFVYDVLIKEKPEKVIDLASNKGYYAYMAANLGASVVAFDYEEEIVDFLLKDKQGDNRVTPVHMDFKKPTAATGLGLFFGSSYERFESGIVLALGLIHHICITQNVPVYLFCHTCMSYATNGIILEYVDPTDVHVASWNKKASKDYSIERIEFFMKVKFSYCEKSEVENGDGLNRRYLYFHN